MEQRHFESHLLNYLFTNFVVNMIPVSDTLSSSTLKYLFTLFVVLLDFCTMDSALDKKIKGFRQIAQEKLHSIFCSIPGKYF